MVSSKVIRESLVKSKKLDQVQPEEYRDHYPRLLLYGYLDGAFEFDVKAIWSDMYLYNRPGVNLPMLGKILAEYQRVGLLYRWTADGKEFGYWEGTIPPKGHFKKSGIKVPEVRTNLYQSPALENIVLQSNTLANNVVTELELELEQEQEKELEQEREGTHVPSGAVQVGSSASPSSDSGLPGIRGAITNPAEEQTRRWQQMKSAKTFAPTTPPPAGPEHPVAQKFLEFVGRLPKYLKQSSEWDRIARQLEERYSRADLLSVIDWLWGPHSDRWWATKIEERRSDPFVFFSDSIVSIMDQYQDMTFKQKRSANKEGSSVNNSNSTDYNPVSSW